MLTDIASRPSGMSRHEGWGTFSNPFHAKKMTSGKLIYEMGNGHVGTMLLNKILKGICVAGLCSASSHPVQALH